MKITPVKKKTIIRHNMTVTQLAREIRLRNDEVGNVLNGIRHTPHIQEAVARYFGRSVEELFGRGAWMKVYKRRGRAKAQKNDGIAGGGNGRARQKGPGEDNHQGPA